MESRELNPPERLLLGPGPSNVSSRVLRAMAMPIVGHLDPYFVEVMYETQALLRSVFRTKNKLTLPLSATGMGGMEAALTNLVEAGDEVIVGVNGFFGERMCEVVSRLGGKPLKVEAEWGTAIDPDSIETTLKSSNAKVVAMVNAETSTGVQQPIKDAAALAKAYDSILVVDAVTSLGGCELDVDAWGVDVCYSGTQKCLNCPPGLAPITVGERAIEKISKRKTKVPSFYFDLAQVGRYWSDERAYHHTAPISMIYALREALKIALEEGLENRWARHRRNSQALVSGVEALGIRMLAREECRLPTLNAISVPEGVADASVRKRLLSDFNIEIGGGLGALKGRIWRVGLMGMNSNEKVVITALGALELALKRENYPVKIGEGSRAALEFYGSNG